MDVHLWLQGPKAKADGGFSVRVPEHNYNASSSAIQHPSFRQLYQEQRHQIEILSRVGALPRTILAAIREELPEGKAITARDVYNARTQLRGEALAGRTPIQALVNELNQDQFFTGVSSQA